MTAIPPMTLQLSLAGTRSPALARKRQCRENTMTITWLRAPYTPAVALLIGYHNWWFRHKEQGKYIEQALFKVFWLVSAITRLPASSGDSAKALFRFSDRTARPRLNESTCPVDCTKWAPSE